MNKIGLSALLARTVYKPEEEDIIRKLQVNNVDFSNFRLIEKEDLRCMTLEINNQIHIVFRGTNSIKTWLETNFKFQKEEIKGTDMEIHKGFMLASRRFIQELYELVKDTDKRIIFSAHSLGASLSLLIADLLYDLGIRNLEVIAFEPARIGNKEYIRHYSRCNIKRLIIKNNVDIVPMLPFKSMGYADFNETVLYINRNNDILLNPHRFYVTFDRSFTIFLSRKIIEALNDHKMSDIYKIILQNKETIDMLIEHKCI